MQVLRSALNRLDITLNFQIHIAIPIDDLSRACSHPAAQLRIEQAHHCAGKLGNVAWLNHKSVHTVLHDQSC